MNKFAKLSLFAALFALAPFVSICQQIVLLGKITDTETGTALPYATIFLTGNSLSTISNGDGEFNLTMPASSVGDTIKVSMMGYAIYQKRVGDIISTDNLSIRLAIKPIRLEEVVIMEKKITAKVVVTKAFENIENNFPTKTYRLNGFYREMHLENNKSVELIEAAIDIYDNGYKIYKGDRPRINEKVNLKNVRASKNYRNACFDRTRIEQYNLVVGALVHNPVRYRPSNLTQWEQDKAFKIDTMLYMHDRPIYVVSFLSYLPEFPNFERKNAIYIDAENYSIYKYTWEEYAKEGKYSEKPWRLSKGSKYTTNRKRISTVYEYGNYNGKMYLTYFDEKCYDDIVDSKIDSVIFESLGHVTLVTGQIESDEVKMIQEETLHRDQSLATQLKTYDPQFWRNYEHVKVMPLTRRNVADLAKEMPLEEQFKIEGSHK